MSSIARTACVAAFFGLASSVAVPALAGSYTVVIGPPGSPQVSESDVFGSAPGFLWSQAFPAQAGGPQGQYDGQVDLAASSARTRIKSFITGTRAAVANATLENRLALHELTPPEGANFAGGKLIVYATLPRGDVRGDATVALKMDVEVRNHPWAAQGSNQRSLADQPGAEELEVPVAIDLPTTLDSTDTAYVHVMLTLTANASIAPSAGSGDTAIADAGTGATLTGFRVLNAAGVQITGFKLKATRLFPVPERAPAAPGMRNAVEFSNSGLGHFFVTASPEEIAKFDSGAVAGWQRTGQSFNVYSAADAGRVAVCRFLSDFGARSSYFYAPRGLGCEEALKDPAWRYQGEAFYVRLPDAAGACPAGTVPIYRLFNQGQGGAPNHRYTASDITTLDMIFDGWKPEGAPVGVGWCSPQ